MNLLPTATSTDVQEQQPRIAILPIGSFEQHGCYLPLITDTAIACIIGQEIAGAYPVHLLPPITMSCSHEHASFPGTVSISAKTLFAVVDDIRASLARSGITKLVIVNGHGGTTSCRISLRRPTSTAPLCPSSRSDRTGTARGTTED